LTKIHKIEAIGIKYELFLTKFFTLETYEWMKQKCENSRAENTQ